MPALKPCWLVIPAFLIGRNQPDFSSMPLRIPISHSLGGESASWQKSHFSSNLSNFCKIWLKLTPLECPFPHRDGSYMGKRGRPELEGGHWRTGPGSATKAAGAPGQLSKEVPFAGEGRGAVILQIRNMAALMVILVAGGIATGSTYPEESSDHTQVRWERPTKQVGCGFLTTLDLKFFNG